MSGITTTDELAAKELSDIEYAHVRLSKGDPTRYEAGRVVGKYQSDLTLHYRGHTTEVTQIEEWELEHFKPVTSSVERMQIEAEVDA